MMQADDDNTPVKEEVRKLCDAAQFNEFLALLKLDQRATYLSVALRVVPEGVLLETHRLLFADEVAALNITMSKLKH